jgi:hypothetical protein
MNMKINEFGPLESDGSEFVAGAAPHCRGRARPALVHNPFLAKNSTKSTTRIE